MKTSEKIDAISAALAKAQGEFRAIAKNKTGKVQGETKAGKPFSYEYKYAALPDVLDGIKEALAKNGLAVMQPTIIAGSVIVLITRIAHSSGQFIESEYPVCSITGEHQKMGAAMTYARRYALTSLVGVAADEDADGYGADHVDQRDAERAKTEAAARVKAAAHAEAETYVERAIIAMGDADSVDFLKAWWKSESSNRQLHFQANDDPLFVKLKAEFAKRGAELTALDEPTREAAE